MEILCSDCNNHKSVKCPFHSHNRSRTGGEEAPMSCLSLSPPSVEIQMDAVDEEGTVVDSQFYNHADPAARNAMRLFVWYWLRKKCTVSSIPLAK